eukprot:462694_1
MVLIPSLTTMRPTSVTTTTNNNNNISIPPQPNQSPLSIANESQSSPLSITNESQSSSSETKNNTENNKDIQPKIKDKDKDKDNDIEIDNISAIIPEQPNKHYLSIIVSPEWNDSKLIPELVRHISQHTGKHIGDVCISNGICLGFFTDQSVEYSKSISGIFKINQWNIQNQSVEYSKLHTLYRSFYYYYVVVHFVIIIYMNGHIKYYKMSYAAILVLISRIFKNCIDYIS